MVITDTTRQLARNGRPPGLKRTVRSGLLAGVFLMLGRAHVARVGIFRTRPGSPAQGS